MAIQIRPGKAEDKAFIISTWVRGQYYGDAWFTAIDTEAYYMNYSKYLEALLIKSDITVACLSEDEDIILGYAVSSPGELHWVFVKKPWRAQGIARSLVAADVTTITSITKPGLAIAKKHNWKFNPWRANEG
jgi:GNAT superfamily N-acetyltransferase